MPFREVLVWIFLAVSCIGVGIGMGYGIWFEPNQPSDEFPREPIVSV